MKFQGFKNRNLIDTYLNIFQDLKNEPVNLDLEIRCRDETVVTSSLLLVLSSGYLKDILSGVPEGEGNPNNYCIYLGDFDGITVRKLIEFLSSGVVFCNDDVSEFHELIRNLGINSGDIKVEGIKHEFLDPTEFLKDEGSYEDMETDENNYAEFNAKYKEDYAATSVAAADDDDDDDDDDSDEDAEHLLLQEQKRRRQRRLREEMRKSEEEEDDDAGEFTEDGEPRIPLPLRDLECTKCHVVFRTEDEYQAHRKDVYPNELWTCPECKKQIQTSKEYYHHVRKHKISYTCQLCDLRFSRKLYYEHMRGHKEEFATCEYCGKKLKHTSLKSHVYHMHTITEYTYECKVCHRKFRTKATLTTHMLVHLAPDEGRNFICDTCGFATVSLDRLKSHKRTHVAKKKIQCDQCEKSFDQQYFFKIHQENHRNERRQKCDQCGKSFNNQKSLEKHGVSVHGPLRFKCAICSMAFKTLSGVKYHLISHSNTEPYQCGACGITFKHKEIGRRHLNSSHPDEKHKKVKYNENEIISQLYKTSVIVLSNQELEMNNQPT